MAGGQVIQRRQCHGGLHILGLTGGMGMGKSTVATMLAKAGLPVFDADATVRALQADGGAALPAIKALVPGAVQHDHLDRGVLRRAVVAQPGLLRQLERVMHPLVWAARNRFLAYHRRIGTAWVVLDVPLLFETGSNRICDHVLVVSAPALIQAARIARRRGVPVAEARKLIARQMPDARKRLLADTVIETGVALPETRRQVRSFLKVLTS
ncbi:dephospho-CoA kinase [Acetobacter cibinongensis NRIC 0482]|nr:dephospho-CoA kinase [Acetobacter cibinongensis NRIC 0482]